MNIVNSLTLRHIKSHKRRSLLTVLSIIAFTVNGAVNYCFRRNGNCGVYNRFFLCQFP